MLHADDSNAVRRLNDLRATLPSDHTLQNLLNVLNAKLELCSKLPVYEYEAAREGHLSCVSAFRQLAESERQQFDDIVGTLRQHLNTATPAKGVGVGEAAQ